MAGSQEQFLSDEYVARTIRIKARKLARDLGASDADRHDFQQRFWMRYIRARERHDPDRGQMSTFVDRVLTNEIRNMISEWNTQKRSAERRALKWNDTTEDEESLALEETYSQEDYFVQTGFGSRPESETRDTRTDIQWALNRLPPDLREIAERLMHASVAEVARELGIPRATLYGKIKKIEEVFRAAGLGPAGA